MKGWPRLAAAAGSLVAAALVLAAPPPTAAQEPPSRSVEVVAVDTSGAPTVEVVLRTTHPSDPVDLVVEVDGTDQPATNRPVDGSELAVGLVVDNAPDLADHELRALRSAAVELVLAAPPGTGVAVAGTAGPGAALAADAAGAVAAVTALTGPERGEVDPVAAVSSTVRALGGRPDVPPVVVLLGSSSRPGDGDEGTEIARRLASQPVTIDVLALGAGVPPWLAEVAATPGVTTATGDARELAVAARAVGAGLASLRVVAFDLPPGSGPVSVEVAEQVAAGDPIRLVAHRGGDGSGGSGVGTAAVVSGSVVLAVVAAALLTRRTRATRTAPTAPASGGPAPAPPPGDGTPDIAPAGPGPLHTGSAAARRDLDPPTVVGATPSERPARPTPREGRLLATLADPDPTVRRRGAQLAGHVPPSAAVRARLVALLGDDAPVAEMAAYSLGEQGLADPSAVVALSDVARHHPDDRCREAAVAALGAIGAGLPAVLTASADACAAVRRRAVVALAPFDGPEVDDALRRAAADGDREVRQAAEHLAGR